MFAKNCFNFAVWLMVLLLLVSSGVRCFSETTRTVYEWGYSVGRGPRASAIADLSYPYHKSIEPGFIVDEFQSPNSPLRRLGNVTDLISFTHLGIGDESMSSAMAITSDNKLYVWGIELNNEPIHTPLELDVSGSLLEGLTFKAIGAGAYSDSSFTTPYLIARNDSDGSTLILVWRMGGPIQPTMAEDLSIFWTRPNLETMQCSLDICMAHDSSSRRFTLHFHQSSSFDKEVFSGNLWSWDSESQPQNPDCFVDLLPSETPNIVLYSVGYSHYLALIDNEDEDIIIGSGSSAYGQLGTIQQTVCRFINFTEILDDPSRRVFDLAAGALHSLVLDNHGTIWSFGSNEYGQLGRSDDFANYPDPAPVIASAIFVQISILSSSSYALDDSGTLWAWGYNWVDDRGMGETVPGLLGPNFPRALYAFPEIVELDYGLLNIKKMINVPISTGRSTMRMIVTKKSNSPTTAPTTLPTFSVVSWASGTSLRGSNSDPLLISGPPTIADLPPNNYQRISSRKGTSLILDPTDRSIWAFGIVQDFGDNLYIPWNLTALGPAIPSLLARKPINSFIDGLDTTQYTDFGIGNLFAVFQPVSGNFLVSASSSVSLQSSDLMDTPADGATHLSVGDYHVAFIRNDILYTCMIGSGEPYALGNGTFPYEQVRAVQLNGIPRIVSAGSDFTVVHVDDEQRLWTFGHYNDYGQLGNSTATEGSLEHWAVEDVNIIPSSDSIVQLASSTDHTLVLAGGKVYGFGSNVEGQLGRDPSQENFFPRLIFVKSSPDDLPIIQISVKSGTSLALASNGQLYGWGRNLLGNGFLSTLDLERSPLPQWIPIPNYVYDGRYKINSFVRSNSDSEDFSPLIATIERSAAGSPRPTAPPAIFGLGQANPVTYQHQFDALSLGYRSYFETAPAPVLPSSYVQVPPIRKIVQNAEKILLLAHNRQLWMVGSSDYTNEIGLNPVMVAENVTDVAAGYDGYLYLTLSGDLKYRSQGTLENVSSELRSIRGITCILYVCAFWNSTNTEIWFPGFTEPTLQSFAPQRGGMAGTGSNDFGNPEASLFFFNQTHLNSFNVDTEIFTGYSGLVLQSASVVEKLVGGQRHVLALIRRSSNQRYGSIYGYAENNAFFEKTDGNPPTGVIRVHPSLFNDNVRDISISESTSMALTSDGKLYVWGAWGQLKSVLENAFETPGLDIYEAIRVPYQIPIAEGYFVHCIPSSVATVRSMPNKRDYPSKRSGLSQSLQGKPNFISALYANQTAPSSECILPSPGTGYICAGDVWIFPSSLVLPPSTTTVFTGNVVIQGNFTAPVTSTLVFSRVSGQTPALSVTGCAEINSNVVLELSESEIKDLAKSPRSIKLVESSCSQKRDISALVQPRATKKSCRKATAKTSESTSESRVTLNVLVTVDSSKCNIWWIVLLSVVGGVLLITGIVLIVLVKSGKLRKYVQPFQGTN